MQRRLVETKEINRIVTRKCVELRLTTIKNKIAVDIPRAHQTSKSQKKSKQIPNKSAGTFSFSYLVKQNKKSE